jgi:capsular polysaccharide biosynthesis protein
MSEEISLREMIETILKGKWIIITITVICLLASTILSFFILKPTYETYSLVRLQSANQNAEMSMTTNIQEFQESLRSASTLNTLIDKNKLDRSQYTVSTIRDMFKLEVVQTNNKTNNVMKIIVKGEDPKKTSQMANMLAFELGIRIEITDRTKVVVDAQKQLTDLQDQIAVAQAKINEAQNQLKNTPEKQVTVESLSQNDLLRDLEQERSNIKVQDAAQMQMRSEVINPLYSELQSRIAETTIELNTLKAAAKNFEDRISKNLERISELESKSMDDKLDINKSIRIMDDTNAIFINPSLEPERPVGPQKLLNMMIGLVVGIILSTSIVLIRHYWRNGSTAVTSNSGIPQ